MGLRRQPVTIVLDGRERTLRYDLNALCLFEEHTKSSLSRALAERSMSATRALLWAGLLHEDPLLTIDDVGKMELESLRDVSEKIAQAFSGDAKTARPPEETPQTTEITDRSTGDVSGVPGATISALTTTNSGG